MLTLLPEARAGGRACHHGTIWTIFISPRSIRRAIYFHNPDAFVLTKAAVEAPVTQCTPPGSHAGTNDPAWRYRRNAPAGATPTSPAATAAVRVPGVGIPGAASPPTMPPAQYHCIAAPAAIVAVCESGRPGGYSRYVPNKPTAAEV